MFLCLILLWLLKHNREYLIELLIKFIIYIIFHYILIK